MPNEKTLTWKCGGAPNEYTAVNRPISQAKKRWPPTKKKLPPYLRQLLPCVKRERPDSIASTPTALMKTLTTI